MSHFCRKKCFFSFCFFCCLLFVSRSFFNVVRSREHRNEAWHYVIFLVVCVTFLNSKIYFWVYLHLVDSYVKNVDERGSEHHLRTRLESP